MKRYSSIVTALCVVLVLLCASASMAVLPLLPAEFPKPVGTATFQMLHGWYAGSDAWYIATAASSIKFAYDYGLVLTPLLSSADGVAARLYWVTNANNFGVAFSSRPGAPTYSGLWEVRFVTWLPGQTPWVITDPNAPVGSPPGLPNAGQATIVDSEIIVDYPIMALGPLGGPWTPAPPGKYRIPEGSVFAGYTYTKQINLPTFPVFCSNPITNKVVTDRVIITDASSAGLAAGLGGANVAPALSGIDDDNMQDFRFIEGGPYLCQKPILEFNPTSLSWRNGNFDYTPIMEFEWFTRSPVLPQSTVINNSAYVEALEDEGLLKKINKLFINANVVP